MIKEIDPASFEHMIEAGEKSRETQHEEQQNLPLDAADSTDKK